MANDNKYIPALRFPEFQNDGEWKIIELGKFAKIVMGQSPSSEAYNERGEGVPLLQGNADIRDRHQIVRVYTTDITKMCDINDIIMTVRAPVGTISRASFQSCIGRGVCAIKTNSEYLYQYLISIEQEWDRLASGSTFVSITSNQIFDRIILVPLTIQEQKKIADCLLSLDKYIYATKRKLEQLKEYKKGLMQRLFPAKGKTTPELRFPEFQNDGEWKTDTMENIFDIKNGYTPSKSNPAFWDNGTIPWFRMEDIRKNGHILSDSIQHITPIAVKNAGLFPAYSIIVATTATIGEHALIIADSLANQQFTFLTKRKSFDDKLDMIYFHYFMFIVDEWCKRNTNAGGLLSVNMDSFKKLTIPYPSSILEQKKIAECFISIDKEIDATKRKLEQLKEHKNGLMQQLFPKL